MVAESAFLRRAGLRMKIPGTVGTRLDTVTASDTVFGIYQHDAIRRFIRSTHRTDLDAGRIVTMVAKFGHKKAPDNGFIQSVPVFKTVDRTVRAVDYYFFIFENAISLNPRSEIDRLSGYVVFYLAGIYTASTPNALVHVNSHSPVMVGRSVPIAQYPVLDFADSFL